MGILWSVSIEEQFYLTWPWVLRRYARWICQICVGLLLLATAYRIGLVLHQAPIDSFWQDTFSRIDAICLGALIAARLDGCMPRLSSTSGAYLIVGGFLGLLGAARWGGAGGWPALWTYPAVATCCALMLIGSLRDHSRISHRSTLVYLGRISYGLYVFHALALKLADQFISVLNHPLTQGIFRVACGGVLTLTLAAASYRWLESPFLRLKARFSVVRSTPIPISELSAVPEA